MADMVETMAYAKEGGVPWHKFGNGVNNKMSPEQMMKAASCDWTVSMRDVFFKKEAGAYHKVPDKKLLVRDTDEMPLTMAGLHWKPVQNATAVDFFKKFVVSGHMSMETLGSLCQGKYIWALAKVNKSFSLGKEDEVRGYLLLMQPHVFGKSMVIQFTPIRVVCWNTLNYALGSSLKGKPGAFRMPHSVAFTDDVKKQAEESLGIATHQMDEFKEMATLLSKKRVTEKQTDDYFCDVLQFDPKQAKKKKDEEIKEPLMLPKFRNAINVAPGHDLTSARGTLWGAVNAVTYVVDHETGRDREAALRTAWFGQKAVLKRRAVDLAIDLAKKAKAA